MKNAPYLLLTGSILTSCGGGSKQAEELPKPNILWVTIEDTLPQFIGCYSNENAQKQVELLSNDNPIVRYWAILGLRSHNC